MTAAVLLAFGLTACGVPAESSGGESALSSGEASVPENTSVQDTSESETADPSTPAVQPGLSGEGIVFDLENVKPQSKTGLWVCPMSLNGGVKEDFVSTLTDKTKWPTVFEKTVTIKLYIEQIYRSTDEQLKAIADFVRENRFTVAVELGGIRVAPEGTPADQMGVKAAENEYGHLQHFVDLGGRVDYITTDHALAERITGRVQDHPGMTMQDYMEQQALYFQYMQEKYPNLKVGSIESLGFFWVKGDIQYGATDGSLPRLNFEEYFSEYVRICKDNGVELDHFHIDFGMQDVEYDGRGKKLNYNRVLAVENYVHSLGVRVGFIAANCFHNPMVNPAPDEEAASRSAAERTLQYFEGYMQAGGTSDTLVFQRWQPYPIPVGDENNPLSSFGIFKSMVTSEWFPQ